MTMAESSSNGGGVGIGCEEPQAVSESSSAKRASDMEASNT
jgi:hypothetical protein